MLTKGAIGNLVNRYKAVLAKCNLINTFGSLAVASMLVLGGAGVAGAVSLGDTETYDAPVSETEFIGNNNTVLTIIGRSEVDGTEATIQTNGADVSIKDIKTMIFGAGSWGTGVGTIGSNATVANGGKTMTLDNIKEIKTNGSIADYNYFFHAFGGNYTLTNIGKINIQTGGIGFMAQPQGGKNANIEVNAEEINIKTIKSAAQISTYNTNGGYGSITMNAKNITLESSTNQACVTVFNGTYNAAGNKISYANKGNIKIVATQNLSITGSTAVNAQFGKDANNTAKIELYANNINITNNGSYSAILARDFSEIIVNATESATISGKIGLERNSSVEITAGTASITGDISVDSSSTLTLNLGGETTVDGSLAADGAVAVNLNSGDASLTVDSSTGSGTVTVSGSGAANDAAGGTKAGLMAKVKTEDGSTIATKFGGMEEGLLYGAVNANGTTAAPNTGIEDTLEIAHAAPLALGRVVMNDVRKRMGDLRSDKNESGVWMRWDGGKLAGDEGLTNNFNTIQIGGDTKVGKNCRFGVAGAFTHGDLDHRNGNGEMETFSFSAYSTWMGENGMFADIIARVGFTNTDLTMKGNRISLDNEALSLSAEYGWRFDICQQFFVEPQVELTYTYLTGADTEVSYADYSVESLDSLIGRAGLLAGWKLPNDMGSVYARASVVNEFLGDSKLSASAFGRTVAHSLDGQDTWLEYGIGANVKLTEKTYIWADVERTAGADLDEEWRGTVGIRYSF